MKKSLFILIATCLIVLLVIIYIIYNYQMSVIKANRANSEFEKYTNNSILGSSLMTLINKVIDNNEKNNVPKDDNDLYINDDKNSIIIEVKFLEADQIFRMEAISKLGPEEFIKNYNTMSFQCIKKEYHKKTNSISYLYFEQV